MTTNGNGDGRRAAIDGGGAAEVDGQLTLRRGGFIAGYPPFEYLELDQAGDRMWQKPRFGLYLHLPYCRKRCTFCFYKVYTNRHLLPMDDYLAALHREIDMYGSRPEIRGRVVNTIYFGGGTPTTLSVEQMRALAAKLRENFNIAPDVEWTVEGEPATLDPDKARTLREIGVTRLSIGVQSFNNTLLDRNGRSHGVEHAFRAIEMARANAFPVINIDLMSGMIDETPETWDASLDTLLKIGPEHVSIYRMEVYRNTLLYAAGFTGPGVGGIPTDEQELALWHRARERLEGAGYTMVAGHAFIRKPEFNHWHRVDMWSTGELLGMGVSSFSYVNGTVFQNSSKWDEYVGAAREGRSAVKRSVRLSSRGVMAREVVLGLKLFRVERAPFRERHGFDVVDLYKERIDQLVNDGLMVVTDEAIELTSRARDYSDMICALFYLPEHNDKRFARFATEDELEESTVMEVATAPISIGSLTATLPSPSAAAD
ncbi:MAG TPA: coproporphyrinogen-III oxidase family protein [Candidatus Acidoferrales bacterium]|nr:coproporphyrinogen-III oxidase family protein [Candidatus Acidoferrales bacterium]